MDNVSRFEDLSSELFLAIFDHLHALDLFQAFASLNSRISSILSLAELHIHISKSHCRHQIETFSSYLLHHDHQVISVTLQDQLRDYSSVIPFFFDRHSFINLRSCKFYSISPSSNLDTVIQKLGSLDKLMLFRLIQPKDILLSDDIKSKLSRTILSHPSLKLHLIQLYFRYNYPMLAADISVNSTVTYLHIPFYWSDVACSIYKILPILRNYRALRILRISLFNDKNADTQTVIPTLPATYEINPPISPTIKIFHLNIDKLCHFHSLDFVLRCMPNLRQFIFSTIISSLPASHSLTIALMGNEWQRLLSINTPHLDIFDIFLSIENTDMVADTNVIIKSFDYFARKYEDWYVAIHQSRPSFNTRDQVINLHGFRRSKKRRYYWCNGTRMILGTLNIHSTSITNDQHHLFYRNFKYLHINIPMNTSVFDTLPSGQLFKHINHLTIEMDSSMLSFWEDMVDLLQIRCNVPENDQKYRADKLADLVDLSRITKLEFLPKRDISQLYFIQAVLLVTSRVIRLKIGNALIFSPMLYYNSSLISLFDRLKSLYLLSKYIGFPLKYASKIVERFPSLIHLELEIYSVDRCTPLFNTLLDGLSKLIHLRIHFRKSLFTGERKFSNDYVIQRRRQAFPLNICNENEVSVKIHEQIMDIYLSGCPICDI